MFVTVCEDETSNIATRPSSLVKCVHGIGPLSLFDVVAEENFVRAMIT